MQKKEGKSKEGKKRQGIKKNNTFYKESKMSETSKTKNTGKTLGHGSHPFIQALGHGIDRVSLPLEGDEFPQAQVAENRAPAKLQDQWMELLSRGAYPSPLGGSIRIRKSPTSPPSKGDIPEGTTHPPSQHQGEKAPHSTPPLRKKSRARREVARNLPPIPEGNAPSSRARREVARSLSPIPEGNAPSSRARREVARSLSSVGEAFGSEGNGERSSFEVGKPTALGESTGSLMAKAPKERHITPKNKDLEQWMEDLEMIFQRALREEKLSIALKSKELLAKQRGWFVREVASTSHTIKSIDRWSLQEVNDLIMQIEASQGGTGL